MKETELIHLLDQLRGSHETEVVEFKKAETSYEISEIGKYFSALCNEANLKGLSSAWLVFGVESKNHLVVGSQFRSNRKHLDSLKKEIADHITSRITFIEIYELNHPEGRVVIFQIPAAPYRIPVSFKGHFYGRDGESLVALNIEEIERIRNGGQSVDFSAKICENLTLSDLDSEAIETLRIKYAREKKNPEFLTKPLNQVLSDLKLMINEKLTYAALILLGTVEAIAREKFHAKVIIEFRNSETESNYDWREPIAGPLFRVIDEAWRVVNNRNSILHVRSGPQISKRIFTFNEDVIREAILNAVTHRDYSIDSEVFVLQFPRQIHIKNPGGFPYGVTAENIVFVSSTRRNGLLADILEKTGMIEQTGQGVDKIYAISLSEGKAEPDYSATDPYQVFLKLDCEMEDSAFHVFIQQNQDSRPDNNKFGYEDIITLYRIKKGVFNGHRPAVLEKLEREGLIRRDAGHPERFLLHSSYYDLSDKGLRIGKRYENLTHIEKVLLILQGNSLKVGDLEKALAGSLSRNPIKFLLKKLVEDGIVQFEGQLRGRKYALSGLYSGLRGNSLIKKVELDLRGKYE